MHKTILEESRTPLLSAVPQSCSPQDQTLSSREDCAFSSCPNSRSAKQAALVCLGSHKFRCSNITFQSRALKRGGYWEHLQQVLLAERFPSLTEKSLPSLA